MVGNDYYKTNEHRVNETGETAAAGEAPGYGQITQQYYNRYRLPIMRTETNLAKGEKGDEKVYWLWRRGPTSCTCAVWVCRSSALHGAR